jgi:hypothetical protein
MRHYHDHRIGEDGGFNDAIQGIVKNSPWWMISAVIHIVLLLILAQIQMDTSGANKGAQMQASLPDEDEDLEEEEEEQPEEEEPEEIEETPIETEEVDDHNEVDTDSEFEETLRRGKFLTRDARMVERKKYGRKKARKSFQFSKR